MNELNISSEVLMKQAPSTILQYMDAAIKWIDKSLGEGYAKEHPELIGAFIQACAVDFQASIIAREIKNLSERLQGITETLEN